MASSAKQSLGRNSIYSLIGTILVFFSTLTGSILIARFLGPSDYGLFSLIQWFRVTAAMILDIGMANAVTKYWAELDGSGETELANKIALILFIAQQLIALIFCVFILFLSNDLSNLLKNDQLSKYLPITAVTLFFSILNTFLRSTLSGMQQFRTKSWVDGITGIINLIGILLIVYLGLELYQLLWLELFLVLFQIFIFGAFTYQLIKIPKFLEIPRTLVHNIYKYCFGVFIYTSLSAVITQRSETFFLSRYHSTSEVAFYGLAFNIVATLTTLIPNTIGIVIMPALANRQGAKDIISMKAIYDTAVRFILMMSIPMGIGGAAVSNLFMKLLYGDSYLSSGPILSVLLIGTMLGSIGPILISLFWALGKPNILVGLMLPPAILNLVLAYILVPKYAAFGAALIHSFVQVISILLNVLYLAHHWGFSISKNFVARVFFSSIPSGIIAYILAAQFPTAIGLSLAIISGFLVYVFTIVVTRSLTHQDLNILENAGEILPKPLLRYKNLVFTKARRFAAP